MTVAHAFTSLLCGEGEKQSDTRTIRFGVGLAACIRCGWQARMTGDTVEEVETFLRKVLNTHIVEVHGKEE